LSSTATAPAIRPVAVPKTPSRLFLSREKQSTVLCLLLALVTLAFYNPVVHNDFTNFDDNFYVTDNTHVRAGLTWDTVKWAFTSFEAANWHPVTWLSHALDCQLFKLNPVGHHYVNVLLHVVNAILLFLLLQAATGFTWRSFMVAALFALHPVNVESVAWVAERKNVLSMLFFLVALHAYGWYVRRESIKRYAVVAAVFAVGLMAKPEIITLPFVLLLWDYWPLRRMGAGVSAETTPSESVPRLFSFLCLEKVPLLLLSAGSGVITWLAQRSGHAFRGATLEVRIGNAAVAYVRYIGKAFWPTRLAALYPHPGSLLPKWEMFASSATLLLITALMLWLGKRRFLPVGWFWFLGTLVPVIGLVQVGVQAMADRYAYIPYIGLFVCVVWGVAEVAEARMVPASWLVAPAVLVLASLGAVTTHQIGYWRDSETFWRHILSVTDMNYTAHDALARVLGKQNLIDEAIAEFNAAESVHQYAAADMVEVAIFEQAHGHVPEAIDQYTQALDAAPDAKTRAVVLSRLGSAFIQQGDIERARKSYAYALRENPENSSALVGSGLLAQRDGDAALAATQISHAMKIEATDVGYLLLGQALRRAGHLSEANDAFAHAQQISQDFAKAQQSAAKILTSAGIKPE
jgi:tetratricopeptide (TPR) repeat protein